MGNFEKVDAGRMGDEVVAGNGLLNRRALLRGALFSAGAVAGASVIARADDSVGADAPDWMKTPGKPFSAYGTPSHWQDKVQRIFTIAPGRAYCIPPTITRSPAETPCVMIESEPSWAPTCTG